MKTVLLAEDNPDDAWMMRRCFKSAGIDATLQLVENGREAVAYISGEGKYADRAEYPLPCIVLLDLKMPYLSGIEVLKWLRSESKFPTLLAVLLTSSNDTRDVDEAYRLGANAFLMKPSELGKLVDVLKSLNEFLLVHTVPPPTTPCD